MNKTLLRAASLAMLMSPAPFAAAQSAGYPAKTVRWIVPFSPGGSVDLLARFAGPAFVAVGARDAITPPAKAKEMAALLAGSRLVEIPGAGHLSNLEQPAAFNAAAEAFLSSIPEPSLSG